MQAPAVTTAALGKQGSAADTVLGKLLAVSAAPLRSTQQPPSCAPHLLASLSLLGPRDTDPVPQCTPASAPPSPFPVPPPPQDVTADYQLGKVLGRGQFGTTRLAEAKVELKAAAAWRCL